MRTYNITINGTTYAVEVEETGRNSSAPAPAAPVAKAEAAPPPARAAKPEVALAQAQPAAPSSAPARGAAKITAPMPGVILDVRVNEGDPVAKGQVLCVLEAMKMENEIVAPAAGTVDTIQISKGASVSGGELLLTLK